MARGLTYKQIYDKTPINRVENSTRVVVRSLKFGMSKKLQIPKAIAQSWSPEKGANGKPKLFKYTTAIEFHDEGKVRLACSCPDFLYRWEYALYKKGAAYLIYSNGDKPQETNPKMIGGCCKHVIAVMSALRKQKLVPKF